MTSSKNTMFLPSTSPMMFITSTASALGRRLSTRASSAPRRLAYARAIFTEPMSGATTTRSVNCLRRKYSIITGAAYRWSNGMSKKPWICGECRSMVIIRSAPATVIRFATSFAVIGTRGWSLRSWRA